ncbi:MAG: AbrB/MazE/SpoVT family DNA-binding domain-containing protein [Cyanobacteria bacterium]|jgi:antitoxin MazE|nr:AbrB/MazE/SpoVT family DNA-binding domain-containing protein [Cyanobacteria bacterium GSL.Bin1]
MTTSIKKWGNSLAVRIPQAIAQQAHLEEGSNVSFSISEEGLIVLIPQHKKKYTLDELLEGVTPEDFEGEFDWGDPVGEEIW